MEPVQAKTRKPRAKKEYVPTRTYDKPPIPYMVSEPNKFWRIRKDLPPVDYWRKRYYRRRITGRGEYRMDPKQPFGQRYGGYLGSLAGEYLGGAAQSLIKSVTGLGAYSVKRNIFMEGRLPEVVNQPAGGGTIIRYQEYLGDVVTSSVANAFSMSSYILNAANPVTFPFLSQIAANYEQYEFEGVLFEFRSTSADALNSVNTALGTVMLATQYDTNDAPFASKLEMLNYEYSNAVKPSENCLHMIECAPNQTTLSEMYTLYGAVPSGSDSRLYHLGRFSVATQGFQGTSVNVGQLHVTYQVRLLKPKMFMSLGLNIPMYLSIVAVASAYTNALPFGTASALSTNLAIQSNTANVTQGGTTLTFNNQNNSKVCYSIVIRWTGSLTAISAPAFTAVGGSVSTYAGGGNGSLVGPSGGESCTTCLLNILFQTDGLGVQPVITITTAGLTLPASGTSVIMRIMQYDASEGILFG